MFLPSISVCEDDSHDEFALISCIIELRYVENSWSNKVSGLHEAEARKALRDYQQARAAQHNIDKVQAGPKSLARPPKKKSRMSRIRSHKVIAVQRVHKRNLVFMISILNHSFPTKNTCSLFTPWPQSCTTIGVSFERLRSRKLHPMQRGHIATFGKPLDIQSWRLLFFHYSNSMRFVVNPLICIQGDWMLRRGKCKMVS